MPVFVVTVSVCMHVYIVQDWCDQNAPWGWEGE